MLVVIVLGIVSIRLLPVSLIPEVDIPYITVQVSAPDMSSRELDQSVIKPLRMQLMQINALTDMTSDARDGSGTIKLTFEHGQDIGYLFIEVNEKIDRSMSSLPAIDRPKVLKASATDIPAFYINATISGNDKNFGELSRFVQDVICKRLEQLESVAMVDVSGCVNDEILIVPDQMKLLRLGLGQADFENIVESANIRLGTLSIRDGAYRYNVKFVSDVSSEEDIRNIWFRSGDRILQLKDIADVKRQAAPRQGLVRSDGEDAVCMAVIKQSEARMADLKASVNKLMKNFGKDYPSVKFEITRDQTELLEYSINNLLQNIITGVILACIVIFLFMRDFRSPALVSLTMPVALIFFNGCVLRGRFDIEHNFSCGIAARSGNDGGQYDNSCGQYHRKVAAGRGVEDGCRERDCRGRRSDAEFGVDYLCCLYSACVRQWHCRGAVL